MSSTALVAGLGLSGLVAPTSSAAPGGRTTLAGNHAKAADTSPIDARVGATTPQTVQVTLTPQDPAAVAALATSVSDPASPQYRHYLTAAQWEARFSPSAASVSSVTTWLHSEGLTVGAVSADRLSIEASGTTAQVEGAFGVTLNTYRVGAKHLQLAANDASVPANLAGVVSGVLGLDQSVATPAITNGSDQVTASPSATSPGATVPIPPPPGFRNPPICSQYYGQKLATNAPPYGGGYPAVLPLSPCGYVPGQLQSAYGLSADYAKGITGKGKTVAIVDAYAAPTLLADAQKYYALNDPTQPLSAKLFSEAVATPFTNQTLCGASGWFGEQALDIEAVHATAPGAHILYVGGKSCLSNDLLSSVRSIVDGGLAQVITNSYGDNAGDLLDSTGSRTAEDTVLEMAATTGITVQFSSGDSGDEFQGTGLVTPDYPASSPWSTAVGGTSLAVNADGSMAFQTGWSTSKSLLCTGNVVKLGGCTTAQVGTYLPPAPGAYLYGSGGGTSYRYPEPYYQVGVVPKALADRNATVDSMPNNRVVPDISMDADPTTGMLVGETQTFADRVTYGQYRIGGTSLASPLLAGVVALADQAAGTPLGFLNPAIYKAYSTATPGAFYDVKPLGNLADIRWDYANTVNTAKGYLESVRTLGYEGPETYCDTTGSCATRDVAITTAKGYDDMTGLGTPGADFVSLLSNY